MPYEKIGNNEPVCIADEVPFEIPDSWEWCRLGSILNKLTDGTHSTPKYVESGIPFISVKDVSSGCLDFSNCKYITKEEHKELYERCNPEQGDILLTKVGTTGIPVIVDTNDEFSLFVSVALLKFNQNLLYNEYLVHLINSPLVQKQATENTKGVGNKNWVMRDIANTLIAIPPLQEQYRIVDELKKYNIFLLEYDKKENELLRLNNSFPDLLKKSILQEAVQGKLVPQDENDEPASVLLDRIRAEKDALIKSGKIKKDKNESIIFRRDNSHYEKFNGVERCIDDEIPFEIPENWTWCRLSEVATVIRGLTFSTSTKEMKDGFSLVLRGGNIDSKTEKLCFVDNIYVDTNIIKETQFLRKRDTLIVASSGTKSSVGKSSYIDKDLSNVSFGGFMMTVRPNALVSGEYIAINIKLYRQKIIASTAGYISNITNPILNNLLIPLPPANEQKRIINSINTLISHLQQL